MKRNNGRRKIHYSKESDILLIELGPGTIDDVLEEGPLLLHITQEGKPILLEIMHAKEFLMTTLNTVLHEEETVLT